MTREVGNKGDLTAVLAGDIRRAAFRRLLLTGSPVRAHELAIQLGRSVEEVSRMSTSSQRGAGSASTARAR